MSLSCQAIGFPKRDISWSRRGASLPQGDTVNISSFNSQDYGTYQCKATNKLGSVTALSMFTGKKEQRVTIKIKSSDMETMTCSCSLGLLIRNRAYKGDLTRTNSSFLRKTCKLVIFFFFDTSVHCRLY